MAKLYFTLKDTQVAIKLSQIACENKSTDGCTLATVYKREAALQERTFKEASEFSTNAVFRNDLSHNEKEQIKGEYIGGLNSHKYDSNSVSNPYGKYGSKYSVESINNPYGAGSPYSNQRIKLYDQEGRFRGNLNKNKYDPDSVSNPYGRYGSKYSSESINNPFGIGSPFNPDNPGNPYGRGLQMYRGQ